MWLLPPSSGGVNLGVPGTELVSPSPTPGRRGASDPPRVGDRMCSFLSVETRKESRYCICTPAHIWAAWIRAWNNSTEAIPVPWGFKTFHCPGFQPRPPPPCSRTILGSNTTRYCAELSGVKGSWHVDAVCVKATLLLESECSHLGGGGGASCKGQ